MKLLDLFSGIGGFSLGLERAGFKTVAFCEIDPFCRRVLAKHWPEVPCYDDIRTLTRERLDADGVGPIDAICGGFPCQDLSSAGEKAGIDGERSGLWTEYARLVGELGPRYVIVENVADLLVGPEDRPGAWFGRVLSDLASIGYDAEWHCIPAASVDAPHIRDRVWLVAYPDSRRLHCLHTYRRDGRTVQAQGLERLVRGGDSSQGAVADADSLSLVGPAIARQERHPWPPEPPLGRVVDGVPRRVVQPQLRSLGNAVVPQIPEIIGRAILQAEAEVIAANTPSPEPKDQAA